MKKTPTPETPSQLRARIDAAIRTDWKNPEPPPPGWPDADDKTWMIERWGRVLTWDEFSNQAQRYGADGSEYGYGEDGTLSRSMKKRQHPEGSAFSAPARPAPNAPPVVSGGTVPSASLKRRRR